MILALKSLLSIFLAGGIYPYPLNAAYPLVRLLPGLTAAKPPAAPAVSPLPAEGAAPAAPAAASAAEPATDQLLPYPVGAREALEQFLPPGLTETLVVQADELVELAKLLASTIRNFTENMRKNLSSGKGS